MFFSFSINDLSLNLDSSSLESLDVHHNSSVSSSMDSLAENSNVIDFAPVPEYPEKATSLNTEEIMKILPHRYPMLLLDRLEDIEIGCRAKGIKNVTVNDSFFPGHFPDHPVMPGVLIVEAMAQAAAALVMHSLGRTQDHVNVYFMSISNARFRQMVKPGDTLCLHVEQKHNRGNVWKFQGTAKVNNTIVAEASYSAVLKEK